MSSDQKQRSFDEVLAKIQQADDSEILAIMKALIRRYETLFPDWEVMFLSLPKNNPEERAKVTDSLVGFLQNHASEMVP